MLRYIQILSSFLLLTRQFNSASAVDPNTEDRFPDNFLFGTATASYQIEGAWNEDGKAESIWDYTTHNNLSSTADGSNGDVACDSYRLWRRDVEMLRELGAQVYRFSISWPRLLPDAFSDRVNPAAAAYYGALVDELLLHGIQPAITIYHWDLPQQLQDLGGWANDVVVDLFVHYADVVYGLFGDRVKIWVTINEPKQICLYGYGEKTHAPQVGMSGVADYLCAKNVLLAHAKAWRLYDEKYRAAQGGVCGLTCHVQWYQPASDAAEDVQAALDAKAFEQDLYMHPIFSETGDYPSIMKTRVAQRSKEQGYLRSRLPELSPVEVQLIKGTADFYGANSYSSFVVRRGDAPARAPAAPSYEDDMDAVLQSWPADMQPDGYWAYYKMFLQIRDEFGNPPVYILENGLGSEDTRADDARARHYQRALLAVRDAVRAGADVRLYTAWSLMDNFEWANGYTLRFGLYQVDFSDPNRTRVPKTSALVFRHATAERRVDLHYWPSPGDFLTLTAPTP